MSDGDHMLAWQRHFDAATTTDDIYYCFRLLLGRPPGPDEWPGHAMQAGEPLERVVAAYLSSLEFDRRQLLRRPGGSPPLHRLPGFRIYASPDDPGSGDLIRRGVYEPAVARTLHDRLRPGDGCVDIGANVGYFALLAASLVGAGGQVYAVEANADNARLLEASRLENGFDQLIVLQIAAGAAPGVLALHTMHATGTASALAGTADQVLQARTVPSLPLDWLVADTPRIALLKIDIDGGEYGALRGCTRLLATHRPALVTEFSPGMLHDVSGVDAYTYLDFLRAQGYALSVLADGEDRAAAAAPTETDHSNEAILAALTASGKDHIDLLGRPLGAPPPPPAAPARAEAPTAAALRQARMLAEEAAARIAAADRHAMDAERRARLAVENLAAVQPRHAAALAAAAALETRLAAAEQRSAAFAAQAQAAEDRVRLILNSRAWRFTAPLRRLRGWLG